MIAPTNPQPALEAACDAVLDQILDWPVIDEDDMAGEKMGRPVGRITFAGPRVYRDTRIRHGFRFRTPEEVTAWFLGMDGR